MKNTRAKNIRQCWPRGFTLVELVTAMSIVSILMLAIGSALSFSLQVSTGQGSIDQANLFSAADASDQITDDLNVATSFSERTANSIAFCVPTRNGGTPNQVRYAWDGISGHALTRQFLPTNTQTFTGSSATYPATTILNGVTNFSLQYSARQMGSAAATDAALLSPSNVLFGVNNYYNVDATHWCSQCVTLSLPVGATTYTITRIQVNIATSGPQDGVMRVRVATSSGSKPATVLQEQPMYESALSSSLEYGEVKFSNLSGLTANQPICVVIGYSSGSAVIGTVQYQSALLSILSNAYWCTSSNGGSTWSSPVNTSNLRVYIYGTVP